MRQKRSNMNTNWADLNREGRRLESIIKQMNKKFHISEIDSLKLTYADRIIKATHEKVAIARIVLGIAELLKDEKADISETLWSRFLE